MEVHSSQDSYFSTIITNKYPNTKMNAVTTMMVCSIYLDVQKHQLVVCYVILAMTCLDDNHLMIINVRINRSSHNSYFRLYC